MLRATLALLLVSTIVHAKPKPKVTWYLVALSADGARALIKESVVPEGDDLHYRIIALATGKTEVDGAFPALAKLPPITFEPHAAPAAAPVDSAELAADLRAAGKLLAGFPLAASDRVSARAGAATFGVAEDVYAAHDGAVGKRVGTALSSWLLPDGTIVLRTGTDLALVDGQPIANTHGVGPAFVLAATGAVRFLTADKTAHQICVAELATAKPYAATKRACLPADEHELLVGGQLSPHGTWAAITTQTVHGADPWHVRVLDVEHGKVVFDTAHIVTPTAVSDDGLVVVSNFKDTVVIDPRTKAVDRLAKAIPPFTARFRSPTELVIVTDDGSVSVVKPATWKHAPWTDPLLH